MAENRNYSAENIKILEGLDAVRKRPGMYIGSTGIDGLHHLVYEIVDNSIDEAMAGYCDHVLVVLEKNNVVRVEDNGRGIPVGMHPTEGVSALEIVLTRLHAGGKFDKGSYKVSGGLHGVGISVVNALSSWLEATVYTEGFQHFQRYKRGVPEKPVEKLAPAGNHGTTIRWAADPEIFKDTTVYDFDVLARRLRELAFLNSKVTIIMRDERLTTPKEVVFQFEGGISHFVKYLNESKQVFPTEPIFLENEKNGTVVELALQYNDGYNENILTFVNDINTHEGGTHLEGLKSALTRVMNEFLKNYPKLSKKLDDEKLTGDDVRAGLSAVLSTKVQEPQFEGQTKTKLGNSDIRGIVESTVNEKLTTYFQTNPKVIEKILEKCISEASARIAARRAKEATRRKSGIESFGLPGKLADCSLKDPNICEVYIVEGDSAGGSAKKGRDSKTQAILPLWGKMLNVEKTRPEKVVSNEKLQPVIASLGTGIGKDFDISKLRYNKVIIMADADVDGSHIRTLLLTFFFRYMPELIEKGHIYLAMPPLYKVSYNKIDHYVYSDDERDEVLNKIGRDKNPNVQRYKGLGEMDGIQLWETTMNPETRKMRVVSLPDAIEADRIFSTLMGDEVEPRRKFIEENAIYATLDV